MTQTTKATPYPTVRTGDYVRFRSDSVDNVMGQSYCTDWFQIVEINWYAPVSFHMIGRDGMPYSRFPGVWETIEIHPYSLKHNRER